MFQGGEKYFQNKSIPPRPSAAVTYPEGLKTLRENRENRHRTAVGDTAVRRAHFYGPTSPIYGRNQRVHRVSVSSYGLLWYTWPLRTCAPTGNAAANRRFPHRLRTASVTETTGLAGGGGGAHSFSGPRGFIGISRFITARAISCWIARQDKIFLRRRHRFERSGENENQKCINI